MHSIELTGILYAEVGTKHPLFLDERILRSRRTSFTVKLHPWVLSVERFYYYLSQSSTLIENTFCGFPITVFVRMLVCCGCAVVRKYTFGVQNIYRTHIYRFIWLNRTFTKLSLNIVIILVHVIGCVVSPQLSVVVKNTQEYMRSVIGLRKE